MCVSSNLQFNIRNNILETTTAAVLGITTDIRIFCLNLKENVSVNKISVQSLTSDGDSMIAAV